ncbi:hypothetical protein LCGC14_1643370 [marine sediment metagenome]|uniref:Uncharacterized protein n=1 Tax=marine sediment metagenome TaxID=412755 RepID=A0A0F9KYT5_9ZZZZ
MQPEFHGENKDGRFLFNSPKVFDAYCAGQPDGKYYLNMHKVKTMKTNEQLGYFHAVVVPTILKQMIEDGNRTVKFEIGGRVKKLPLTEDMIVVILKEIWAKSKSIKVKSKSRMTKEEASELIDVSIEWAARYLHCSIPEPSKL